MRRKTEDSKALHVFLSEDWHEWLRRRAFEERSSIAELVRKALAAQYPDLPKRDGPEGEGRKGGYAINPHAASYCADRQG